MPRAFRLLLAGARQGNSRQVSSFVLTRASALVSPSNATSGVTTFGGLLGVRTRASIGPASWGVSLASCLRTVTKNAYLRTGPLSFSDPA
jgi:hypothetical protein